MTEADRIGIAVKCKVCGMMKKPRGRSAAPAAANSLCDYECPGYWDEPRPGDLWPGERASEFGYSVTDDATIASDKSNAARKTIWKPYDVFGVTGRLVYEDTGEDVPDQPNDGR